MKVLIEDDREMHCIYIRQWAVAPGSFPESYIIPEDYVPDQYDCIVDVRPEVVALYDHHRKMLMGMEDLLSTIYEAELEKREALERSPAFCPDLNISPPEKKGKGKPMPDVSFPLFPLGRTLITPGAMAALDQPGEPSGCTLLARHQRGEQGALTPEDHQANQQAIAHGDLRIFSAFMLLAGQKIWVITEHDRSSTTIMLPSEY